MIKASYIEKGLAATIQLCAEYREKGQELFRSYSYHISDKHMQLQIITNPKCLFNLVQSNFLIGKKEENVLQFYQLKTEILTFILNFFQKFPLNAMAVYEQAYLVVENNRKINFVVYLIKQIREALEWQFKNRREENQTIFQSFLAVNSQIFSLICNVCTLNGSDLKEITNNLTDLYYKECINTEMLKYFYRLLDSGLQEKNNALSLAFIDNYKNSSMKVQFANNKWPFSKGMTVFLWIKPLRQSDFVLFSLKTDEGNDLSLQIEDGKLIVHFTEENIDNKKSSEICQMPFNSQMMIGMQLEEAGLFSSSYILHLNVNGTYYQNIATIAKLQSSQLVSEFSLLNHFIGEFYGVVVTSRRQLDKFQQLNSKFPYGISHQFQVQLLLEKKILNSESIICIFNPDRHYQKMLLNYMRDNTYASFEGRLISIKSAKYSQRLLDVYLPFLYLASLIKQKGEGWKELFDLVFMTILSMVDRYNYQTDNVLFILYFLQINAYKISQTTLDFLLKLSRSSENFYLNLVFKYIDVSFLLGEELKIDPQFEAQQNLSQKITLLFYLQTKWLEKWNLLQGFTGWWSPHHFYGQNDQPYNCNDFIYNPNHQTRVEWSVMNFVTRDYCKAFLEPVFKLPKYAQINRFQREYIGKECFNIEFTVDLYQPRKRQVVICKKVSNSRLDIIKNKLLGNRETVETTKKVQPAIIKQFSTDCLFIDTLTIVEGTVRITKEGCVTFASQHIDRSFDHMCIKGFKNEIFYYICIPFQDIRKVYQKRFNASHNGICIKQKDGRETMLHFYRQNASNFVDILSDFVKIQKDSYDSYLQADQPFQWIDKNMSNFEYLQWLNEIAGRNYNDVTQYPVIPWVYVTNDDNPGLDDGKYYRDLTKNMGLQGDEDRIRYFMEKYHSNNEEELFSQYHFGTHYSSSAIIFNFLIRIRPYSIGALALQSGKFDCADRIFHSYYGSWNNAVTSPTDLRELIPQIYTLPQMFVNLNNYEYGLTQDKVNVDNVFLPNWAKQNPYLFVATLRKKLESRYVSESINSWIDLIYGYKQRGKDAIENVNIFYPLTYENCIDLDKVTAAEERISFETQIAHFGQNPAQIIGNNLHPSRRAVKAQWEDRLVADGGQLTIQKCYLTKVAPKQEKYLLKSVFQGGNSILCILFISDDRFLIVRKHEYCVFKMLTKQKEFLLKEKQVAYELQSQKISFNYKQLSLFVPAIAINEQIVLIGGLYGGNISILFIKESKYNRLFKINDNTITALAFCDKYQRVFIGDDEGYLKVYKIVISLKQIEFQTVVQFKAHDRRISEISVKQKANLVCMCSDDGTLSLFNLYSLQIFRSFHHPKHLPISFVHITINPLYSVVFYSLENSTIYVYSINGQFIDSICEKSGFVYNLHIMRSTDFTECLVYLNAQRELFIWELPFLRLKRKIKVKKEQYRITCLSACSSGKIVVAGTEEGALHLITNPASY